MDLCGPMPFKVAYIFVVRDGPANAIVYIQRLAIYFAQYNNWFYAHNISSGLFLTEKVIHILQHM